MDIHLQVARSNLKLAEMALQERLKKIAARPKGMILRRNQATHTLAMLSLIAEIILISSHDPETWWENDDPVPF